MLHALSLETQGPVDKFHSTFHVNNFQTLDIRHYLIGEGLPNGDISMRRVPMNVSMLHTWRMQEMESTASRSTKLSKPCARPVLISARLAPVCVSYVTPIRYMPLSATEYRQTSALRKLANELRKDALEVYKASPDVMRSFQGLMSSASKEGALSTKVKELMALAIAISTKCDGCLVFHVQNAEKHGASRREVVETIGVAIETRGGTSTVYEGKALAAFDELTTGEKCS